MSKRLLQLLRDNATREVSALAVINADTNEPTMFLYDIIDAYWGVSAADFNKELMNLMGKTVHLRIDSPGGDVFQAEAMATMIKQHGNVIAHIDGLAASAATGIACAAKSVEISQGGFYMIHNAWSLVYGNKHEMNAMANLLDKVDGTIVANYTKKSGKSDSEVIAWMDDETWFTAQEALDNGFVDSVFTGDASASNSADGIKPKQWNLSAFTKAPKALTEPAPAPNPQAELIAASKLQIEANQRRLHLLEIT